MKLMITLYRYSIDGFVSKEQTYKYNQLINWKNLPDLEGLNNYQKKLIINSYNKSIPLLEKLDLNDFKKGIWAFVGILPEQHWINQSLNHLSEEELSKRKLFTAYYDKSIEVYSTYGLVPIKYTIEQLLKKYGKGTPAYLPERCI